VSKPDDDWYTMWSRDRPPDEVLDCVTTCNVIWTLSFRDWSLPSHEAGAALPAGSRFGQTPAFLRPAEMGFNLVERWQFNQNQVTRAVR
jgi:mannosyltransferase